MRRVRQQVAVMVGNAAKMLLPTAGEFIKNTNYCIKVRSNMCENVYCSCKYIKPLTYSYKVLFYLFLKLQLRLEVTSYSVKNIEK